MSERSRNLVAAAVIAASLGIVAVVLVSADPAESDRAHSLAARLSCPVCESESIADSPSAIARDLYDLIAERVAEGWTDEEIVDSFVAVYGETVLLDPRIDARTLALWGVPILAAAVGIAVILAQRTTVAARPLTPEEQQRIDAALRSGT